MVDDANVDWKMVGWEEERDVESETGRDNQEEIGRYVEGENRRDDEEERERVGSICEIEKKNWIKNYEIEYFILLNLFREFTILFALRG